jgi:colicin import membrane protein
MNNDTPYSVPREPGRWRAVALAVIVHAALLTFLWIGVNWQSHAPEELQAEIWSEQARDSAPAQPDQEPEPQPKPEPVVKTAPKAEPDTPPPPKVDIALEKEKKRKELEKLQQQQAEQERQDKLRKQQAEQQRQEKLKQEKIADQKKTDLQKQAALDKKRKQEAADAQLRDKIRADEMRRLTGSGGSGDAAKTQGNGRATDAAYAQRIASLIRSNMSFPDTSDTNLNVDYTMNLFPDGSLRGEPRILKTSGDPHFDEAVLQAIRKTAPFPQDKTGARPPSIHGNYKLKE